MILQAGLTAGQVAIAAKTGLLWPVTLLAADWPADAFFATTFDDALAALFAGERLEESDQVRIVAKDIAENGAVVPISVRTSLGGPLTFTLLSVSNPTPAVARFEFSPWLEGHLDTRVKMAESGDVVAVVTADGKHYSARRRIKVTAGGCG
jgi:sulfur-oxidizing protein SoxY